MLILTRPAIGAIESAMRSNDKLSFGVRITAESGCSGPKFSMRFEPEPLSEDVVVEIRDVRVFVDEASMDILRGATVDYTPDGDARGFNFTLDPEASLQSACNSGSSETKSCGSGSGSSCSCNTTFQ
jgi:iron-sulfur cluster assembly accessory protein